jgi:hypothetical protein
MSAGAGHVSPVEQALLDLVVELPAPSRRLPVALMSDWQAAAEPARVQARKAMNAAYEAELVLRPAETWPTDDDPPPGTPGARSDRGRRIPSCPVSRSSSPPSSRSSSTSADPPPAHSPSGPGPIESRS